MFCGINGSYARQFGMISLSVLSLLISFDMVLLNYCFGFTVQQKKNLKKKRKEKKEKKLENEH